MATISDVATRSGLSTATVSRALNGVSTVDPQLVDKVMRAAKELGYKPNGLARNLRRQQSAVIALIISDVENPFFTSIARGVEDVAQADSYSVVLCNSDEDVDKERRYLDVAIQERVAGVILSPTGTPGNIDLLRERGTPMVAVDRPLTNRASDCVLVDSRQAAAEATAHLIARGYERIGCLTGPEGLPTADDRLAGYHDGLRSARRQVNARLVRRAPYRAKGARDAAVDLLAEEQAPDALLVANNNMAIGALDALAHSGLRLGRDVGMVAFDDAPWAALLDPPLTVVAQPAYDIGSTAAQMLLERVGDGSRPARTTTLHAELIVRASSIRN